MQTPASSLRSSRPGPLMLAWGALALVFLPQALLLNAARPEPFPAWVVATRTMTIFLIWALFTPLALAAVRRWPPDTHPRARNVLALAGVALALVVLHIALMSLATAALFGMPRDPWRLITSTATGQGATNVLMALTVFAVCAAELHFAARRVAEAKLVEARLETLHHQLQPHFLFNTLNALAELAHRDASRTEALLLRLSGLLRRSLGDAQTRRISLREELDFLQDYLSIQQALLGDRLSVHIQAPFELDAAQLPPMLLQPLVENALRHGIAPRPRGGSLHVLVWREGAYVFIDILDDGIGLDPLHREGIGLRNTRERLQAEYGEQASFTIGAADGGGTRVELRIPWSTA